MTTASQDERWFPCRLTASEERSSVSVRVVFNLGITSTQGVPNRVLDNRPVFNVILSCIVLCGYRTYPPNIYYIMYIILYIRIVYKYTYIVLSPGSHEIPN